MRPQDGVPLRYVANDGMLVSIEGARFLIDAPARDGISPYDTNPADELTRLEEAKPPYDAVDAILVTHWHEDHFSPRQWRTSSTTSSKCCPALPRRSFREAGLPP